MDTEMTCGQGVAAQAPLPTKLAEVAESMAEVLEVREPCAPAQPSSKRPRVG